MSTVLDRNKLVGPFVILSGLWFASILMLGLAAPKLVGLLQSGQLPNGRGMLLSLSCIILAVMLPWYLAKNAVRFVKPDRLEVSASGISVERLGKVTDYPWARLGKPRRKVITKKVSVIEIPLAGKAKGLILPAEQYNKPLEDVLGALLDAWPGESEE